MTCYFISIRKMKYREIKKDDEHFRNICKWIVAEVMSAGGDGDAMWHSKYYDAKEICEYIVSAHIGKFPFTEYSKIESCEETYILSKEPETSIIITNNKEVFDSRPSWQQVSLVY